MSPRTVHGSRLSRALFLIVLLLTADAKAERRSGYLDMGAELRAMQDDDDANPGMLWVAEGTRLWRQVPANGVKSCAGCHGEVETGMKGVATRLPAFDVVSGRPLNLEQHINRCRVERQGVPALRWESRPLLALTAYVSRASRGEAIPRISDERLQPFLARGRELFFRRAGQLDLACVHCHDERAGHRLGGTIIPQAHPVGYPAYRLEWQTLGSLQRRLRGCMSSLRGDPHPYGAAELVELELYLMQRAQGMRWETPAIRP